jgi:hypothetical protein
MNLINIYDHLGTPKADIKALDSSELFQQKNVEDKLVIEFKLNNYILFAVNDYIIYNGVYYYLRKLPKITEENGFKNIIELEPGVSPEGYIEQLLRNEKI